MDEKGLMTSLEQTGKKQSGLLRILVIVNVIMAAVIVTAFVLLVPKTLSMFGALQEAVTELQELSSSAQESMDGINEIVGEANTIMNDADQMVKDANQIMNDNAAGMQQALENFNSVDFETLNKAINNLSDAVEPLANLANMFN